MLTEPSGLETWNLPWPRPIAPAYREAVVGSCRLKRLARTPQIGYFQDVAGDAAQWILLADGECWMTSSQLEIESHAPHLAAARGHVALIGAGIGLALFNVLRNPAVVAVTLVEVRPDVVDLLRAAAGLADWPGRDRLAITLVDAFEFRPDRPVDYLFVDIWPQTGDRLASSDVQRIQRRVAAATVGWWSQEIDLLRWLAARDLPLSPTPQHLAEWSADLGLPLVPTDPGYLQAIARLAHSRFFDRYRRHPEHW